MAWKLLTAHYVENNPMLQFAAVVLMAGASALTACTTSPVDTLRAMA